MQARLRSPSRASNTSNPPMQLFWLLALALVSVPPAAYAATVPSCRPEQISLGTDSENGNFDGMSHSGTLLVLRNLGPSACSVPAFPPVAFQDADKAKLTITLKNPSSRFMHPGPVMLPVIVAPGAELTSSLLWVSGNVYDHGVCLKPASLSVTLGGTQLTTPLEANICGPAADQVTYTATPLRPDPVYKPTP